MNTIKSIKAAVAVAAMALLAQAPLHAQTWQTVLDYQMAPGQSAQGNALAADDLSNVFASGWAVDDTATQHGLVLKTDTAAVNWYLSDDTNPSADQYSSRLWRGLGFDSDGDLYSVGSLVAKCSTCPFSWQVRKSSDRGLSWSTVDLSQYTQGLASEARAFAADASGNIYVAGYGSSPAAKRVDPDPLHWLVRKSADGGQTWTTVDDYYSSAKSGYPKWGIPEKAHFASGVGLFVIGQTAASAGGYSQTWTVRRSLDGGATWSTVDLYQPGGAGYISIANSITSDEQGNLYVVGRADVPQVFNHKTYTTGQWIIRKSSDGGNTWLNVDVLTVGVGKIANASAIATDSAGNLVVAGAYQDAQGFYRWLVRRSDSLGQWQSADDFQLAAGYDSKPGPTDIIADAAGNLLLTGKANSATGAHWIVRRLTNTNP